jgi:hypothetical protein
MTLVLVAPRFGLRLRDSWNMALGFIAKPSTPLSSSKSVDTPVAPGFGSGFLQHGEQTTTTLGLLLLPPLNLFLVRLLLLRFLVRVSGTPLLKRPPSLASLLLPL